MEGREGPVECIQSHLLDLVIGERQHLWVMEGCGRRFEIERPREGKAQGLLSRAMPGHFQGRQNAIPRQILARYSKPNAPSMAVGHDYQEAEATGGM